MAQMPLEHRAAQRERELHLTMALDRIRDSINDDENPQRMFISVVELLHTHFNAQACAVILLNEASDDIEAIASIGLGNGAALDLCRAAMRNATPQKVENPYYPHTIGNQIVLKAQPLGGLILARSDHPFDEDEIALLAVAERQIDSAIVQARTIWKLIERNKTLEGIYRIDQVRDQMTRTSDRIIAFVEALQDALEADFVLLDVLIATQWAVIDPFNFPDEVIANLRSVAAATPKTQLIPTPSAYPGLVMLAAPCTVGNTRLGSIIIGRSTVFTAGDHRLLHALISQIDSALHESISAETLEIAAAARPQQPAAVFNGSIRMTDAGLLIDGVRADEIAAVVGTPVYIYSLPRAIHNLHTLRSAFQGAGIDVHVHYSAKANGSLAVLRALIAQGAGIDAVSGGEIYRALHAGAPADHIVFAGVGKTTADLRYAIEQGVGWINIENEAEADRIEAIAAAVNVRVRCALRFNPQVAANTHRHIATGHGAAKFGLTADAITRVLKRATALPHLDFEGIHIHIGSQLHDTEATRKAVQTTLNLIAPYPHIRTLDIGGGFPVAYHEGESLPTAADFAHALADLLAGYTVVIEPGRSVIADAGVLLTQVEYVKDHGGHRFVIVDAGMTEIMRPALYEAHHSIVPVGYPLDADAPLADLVGPVCESTDVLARHVPLGDCQPGDVLAILTAGAYGMVMANNYNARPRPAEVVVDETGWRVSRRRETLDDLLRHED